MGNPMLLLLLTLAHKSYKCDAHRSGSMHGTKFAWWNTQTGMKNAVSKKKGLDIRLHALPLFFLVNFMCYFAF
ncbi:hypothetical protein OIU76_002490 [Salix suchowensis]|uniref:Secreted protein n=1 Tax=Salix koriyanagi TaxID=2511006 RepID=A0A9Q0P6A2_9ROSI|nr:hypothetical protein OIU76_002490 [Salix suchowensis]KAJ6682407.1 hypothetical protein OIU74_020612 [Salix koriyanagi]